jgi:alpha-ketoglutarate-dependent taurine dioxygenase
MMTQVRRTIEKDGFAFLPRFRPEAASLAVAAEIGTPVKLGLLPEVQVLRPREQRVSPDSIYSGNYGLDEFPLHTDLAHWHRPPRYILLRCRVGSPVKTWVVDGDSLVETVGRVVLERGLVRPRRPILGRKCLLRLYQRVGDSHLLRWDDLFLEPAAESGVVAMMAIAAHLGACERRGFCLEEEADTLVIDNHRMLHGRSLVSKASLARCVERIYLRELL